MIGRILGERRQPKCRSDSPHCYYAKEPLAPVFSSHVYEDPWFEAKLLSEQISYIGYPPIINAQLTPEIKGLSICSCRRYIQYPWSRIFNIPARNVLPLRRIELNDASVQSCDLRSFDCLRSS